MYPVTPSKSLLPWLQDGAITYTWRNKVATTYSGDPSRITTRRLVPLTYTHHKNRHLVSPHTNGGVASGVWRPRQRLLTPSAVQVVTTNMWVTKEKDFIHGFMNTKESWGEMATPHGCALCQETNLLSTSKEHYMLGEPPAGNVAKSQKSWNQMKILHMDTHARLCSRLPSVEFLRRDFISRASSMRLSCGHYKSLGSLTTHH